MDKMEWYRQRALRCRMLSRRFIELSPVARDLMGGFAGFSRLSRKRISDWILSWSVSKECERLIRVEDVATRTMALSAMKNMGYVSENIGLIASFCGSMEKGESLLNNGGTRTVCLGEEVRSYLNEILKVPSSKYSDLLYTAKHWVGVLSWDYSKDKEYTQGLSEEEIAQNVKKTREDQEQFFYQSIKEEMQKVDAGEFEKIKDRVHTALELILKYVSEHLNETYVADVWEFMERKARRGDYPKEWLEELAVKYGINL